MPDSFANVATRSPAWKWSVCGLLLLATMLNYMDRQTLSLAIPDIDRELHLTNEQYGDLELGFGVAFAVGGLVTGLLADLASVRWLYPAVLAGWSLAGIATAFAEPIGRWLSVDSSGSLPPAFVGLFVCRVALGFFEAGQWPCALVTSQRLLSPADRPLGNSLLQSGAAVGAILTPQVMKFMVTDTPGSWRGPFQVIGVLGLSWIVPWLAFVRAGDLRRPAAADAALVGHDRDGIEASERQSFWRRFALLVLTVILINLCFQFFRVWLPKCLREYHHYSRDQVNDFTSAYFMATGIGCFGTGLAAKGLVLCGWRVHRARMLAFAVSACLTATSALAADLPPGPLLLGLLLAIGFGALGVFPTYYSLTQELSTRHQGKLTGVLGFSTWICTAVAQKGVGRHIDQTHSYADSIFVAGMLPLVACVALLLFWNWPTRTSPRQP
jgi:ACS family hexuronate transporter-like MFS transporter